MNEVTQGTAASVKLLPDPANKSTRGWRIGSIGMLGFASGLPLALSNSDLQAWFTIAGLDLKTIGWVTLIGQAYVFKFLWAPVLDRCRCHFSVAAAVGSC